MSKSIDRIGALKDNFETQLDDLYLYYHYSSTRIPHFQMSEDDYLDLAIGTAMTKKTNMGGNPTHCNGLPRRR